MRPCTRPGVFVAVALTLFALLSGGTARAAGDLAAETARRLGRGVNVLGYDGLWEGGIDVPFREGDFRLIRTAGFSHVRINLHAFKYMDAADRLDPAVLRRLDWAVDRAVSAGLVPVLDEHDFGACQSQPAACAAKLKAFWREISVHYAGRRPELVFELLNEPGGQMDAATWNALVADLLVIVRAGNPRRTVIVAALNVEDEGAVRALRLPDSDRNLIVTVHYYRPFRFTHQGAPWSPQTRDVKANWGSAQDQAAVRQDLDRIAAWGREIGRPLYLGEFGVYDAAAPEARARWAGFVAREAERHGWPWAVWQFDHDFAVFDRAKDRWNQPLLDALMARSGGPTKR